MSDLFSISVSALQAFQTAISVTGNNIANANTPGYAEETANLATLAPQSTGGTPVGSGVQVTSITRAVSQLNNDQLNTSQSSLGQLSSLQTYTNQIDNIIGTSAGGLSTALQNYYSAWSAVANDPTSTAARQALLSQAQAVASSFNNSNTQLQNLDTSINTGIASDVSQINSLASSIATLNSQIVVATSQGNGQAPNALLDQRDAQLSSLSKLVGFSTSRNSNGSLNVFVGNGTPLVLQSATTPLTTVGNPYNASQLEIASTTNTGNLLSTQITSGDLGGLLAARTQAVNPTINQLGQIATAFAATANAQQNSGLDLNGQFGTNLFSVGAGKGIASSNNSDATSVSSVTVTDVGALTANDYLLSYRGGAYSLTNASTGATVPFTTSGNSISADGLTITLSGAPAANDQFLIQPTATAASTFSVALTNPSQIAAAGAIEASAADTNTGSAAISAGTVTDAANTNLLSTTTIEFTSPTQYEYTVNGATTTGQTLPASGLISLNGWQVQISGTPAANDVFTVQSNAAGTGDNRNALASAKQQTQGVLSGQTISIEGAANALVTAIGSQAQQVTTAQTAQTAVNSQALASVQATSGVNLDTEAANLVQWQQAYQASAQALAIANQTFTTLLDSVNGTYT